jgi:hypothetical protein
MPFVDILQFVHSWLRWVVFLISIVGLIYFLLGLLQKQAWKPRAQTILSMFSSLIGLQWIVGLVIFILRQLPAGFSIRHQWEHLVAMTVVLAGAHIHYAWRRREMPDATRWRNGLILIIAVSILTFLGISVLRPEAIQWRFYLPV